jgi:hypothetical protein
MSLGFLIFTLVYKLGTVAFIFRIFAFILFLILAIFLVTGQDVGSLTSQTETTTNVDGTIVVAETQSTKMFISSSQGSWLGWVFFGLALFSAILFIRDMYGN